MVVLPVGAHSIRRAPITGKSRLRQGRVIACAANGWEPQRQDAIRFAIFEASGEISIIPKRKIMARDDGTTPRGN
jgi:hypothetical protein